MQNSSATVGFKCQPQASAIGMNKAKAADCWTSFWVSSQELLTELLQQSTQCVLHMMASLSSVAPGAELLQFCSKLPSHCGTCAPEASPARHVSLCSAVALTCLSYPFCGTFSKALLVENLPNARNSWDWSLHFDCVLLLQATMTTPLQK